MSLLFFIITLKSHWLGAEATFRTALNSYYHNYLLIDFASLLPFNLLFPLIGTNNPKVLIDLLRCVRLFSIFRIHSLTTDLISFKMELSTIIKIYENILYLAIFFNFSACLFVYVYSYDCGVSVDYVSSLNLIVNLMSGTGGSDVYPCSDTFTIFYCVLMVFGLVVVPMVYGFFEVLASKSSPDLQKILKNIKKQFFVLENEDFPKSLVKRLENYSIFSAALADSNGEIQFNTIYNHLPSNLVHHLIHECYRYMLKKVPFLLENTSQILIKRISLKLLAKIFLPQDYLIYKDDIGEEMYFIDIGIVSIISPDNSKIIKTLTKGDFVGEMALINNSRRMCSVIANSACLVHELKKRDFLEILKNFPEIMEEIKKQTEIRAKETSSLANQKFVDVENRDEDEKKMYSHLSMYSIMNSNYSIKNNPKIRINLLSGMKNVKSGLSVDQFEKDYSCVRVHKRRTEPGKEFERRNSLKSLGKELILSRFSKLKRKWSISP